MLDLGHRPAIGLIVKVPEVVWKTEERYWIDAFRKRFPDLLNLYAGGDGPPGWRDYDPGPLEVERDRHLKATQSPEFRAAAGERTRKRFTDEAFRAKFGKMIAARYHDPAYREHHRAVRKLKWSDPVYKAAQLAKLAVAIAKRKANHGIQSL